MTLDDVTMVAAADDTVPLLLQDKVDVITGITNAEGTEMVTAGKQKPEFLPAIEHGVPNTPIFMLAGNDDWLQGIRISPRLPACHPKSIEYAVAHPDEGIAAFERHTPRPIDPNYIAQQWKDTIPQFGEPVPDLMVLNEADWAALLAALKEFERRQGRR